jgi:hypothetical protein
MPWYVVASIAVAIGGAIWLLVSSENRSAPAPAAPVHKKASNLGWVAGVVVRAAAHIAGVPMAIELVRRYNPRLTVAQEQLLSRALSRAIDGFANGRMVQPHLMAALAVAVPNGDDVARLAAEVLDAFRAGKKARKSEPVFEHPTKPNKPSLSDSSSSSTTADSKQSSWVDIQPSAPSLDPIITPSAPPLHGVDRKEDSAAFLAMTNDLKLMGVDCSTSSLKSFSAAWLSALLVALRESPAPSCPFTLDDLVDEKGFVTKGVAAVFQPRFDGAIPHVYLYSSSALRAWFEKADWNPATREPIRRKHVVEIT